LIEKALYNLPLDTHKRSNDMRALLSYF